MPATTRARERRRDCAFALARSRDSGVGGVVDRDLGVGALRVIVGGGEREAGEREEVWEGEG